MLRIQSLRSWPIALALAIAATAAAQDPEISSRSALSAASGPAPGMEPGAEMMFAQGKLYVQKMQPPIKRGDQLRQDAKDQKDLVKLNCLNEKMTELVAHVREAERALSDMGDSIVRSDAAGRQHHFNRIRILHQKVLILQAEAANCAGEDTSFAGTARRESEVDLTVAGGDPTEPPMPTADSTMAPAGTEQSARPSSPMMPDVAGLNAL